MFKNVRFHAVFGRFFAFSVKKTKGTFTIISLRFHYNSTILLL